MGVIGDIFKRIVTLIQTYFASITSIVVQIQNWGNMVVPACQQKIQKFFQTLMNKPKSKSDYWKFMGLYFSKRFVIIFVAVTAVVGYLLVNVVYPWADGNLWTTNLQLSSQKYSKFNGRARVYDTSNVLVYEGNLSNGKPSGYGVQYNQEGILIYKGNFEDGKYSGSGEEYNAAGVMIYDGLFSNNLYEGEGKLYNDLGRMIYNGNFASGMRSGYGVSYNPDTSFKSYQGNFENDMRSGSGIEFELDGTSIKYTGQFKDDVYSGKGKLYEKKILIYDGDFLNGVYEGEGTLYDPDMGSIKYFGGFKNGLYNGEGKLYNVNTGVIIYDGGFSNGKKQGAGTSYDSLGSKTFEGTFRGDGIDYIGYLGKSPEDVEGEFGEASYRTEKDNKLILTYLSLDASVVFAVDEEKGEYSCTKIILGVKEQFMGLSSKSTAIERRKVMGEPFSSVNYSCADYYGTVFTNLSININDTSSVPSDKYIYDSYFVRFYFNDGRTELKCVEIGKL